MPKQNIEAVNISAMTAEQRDAALALDVERLLRFGRKHKLIKELDAIVARNTLLDLLGLAQPSEENVPKEDFDTPAALLDEMVELESPVFGSEAPYTTRATRACTSAIAHIAQGSSVT